MSDEVGGEQQIIVVNSTRFGELSVPVDSIITISSGLIGFPNKTRYLMIDHKPPFSWLHSVDDPNLAFVVVDGFQFGETYSPRPPIGDKDSDLQEGDDFAILVLITVRPNPNMTTANLKAPVFVNIRNRRGVQIIVDDPRFSTRFPLWSKEEGSKEEGSKEEGNASEDAPGDKPEGKE